MKYFFLICAFLFLILAIFTSIKEGGFTPAVDNLMVWFMLCSLSASVSRLNEGAKP